MKYVVIPYTDLSVSQICLGSTRFGNELSEKETFAMLDAFVEQGGNFIDTAHCYSNWLPGPRSISEKTIGKWHTARGNREHVAIATKGAHPEIETMHISRVSRDEILQDLDESLNHLQTDWIDLYWLHRDDPTVPVETIVTTLHECIVAGKIRYVGCSNWTVERMMAAMQFAHENNMHGFIANQPLWSIAKPNPESISDPTMVIMDEATIDFHQEYNIAVIPYSSQGLGFFQKFITQGVDHMKESDLAAYYNETNVRRAEKIATLAETYSVSISTVVLHYLFAQPFVTIPIIGPRTIEQLTDSLQAIDATIDDVELLALAVDEE